MKFNFKIQPFQTEATVLIPSLARQTVITASRQPKLNDVVKLKAGKINLPELSFTFMEVT